MTSLHQPAALTSACWRGPRTRARATANFLETKAADSLSGAGPPRQYEYRHTRWIPNLHCNLQPNFAPSQTCWRGRSRSSSQPCTATLNSHTYLPTLLTDRRRHSMANCGRMVRNSAMVTMDWMEIHRSCEWHPYHSWPLRPPLPSKWGVQMHHLELGNIDSNRFARPNRFE